MTMPLANEHDLILERVRHFGKQSLQEQLYTEAKLYWHASHEPLAALKKTGRVFFISRRDDFFFLEDHIFNLRENSIGLKWMHAIKIKETIDIFNPKNPNDLKRMKPVIDKYLATLNYNEATRQRILWEQCIDTIFWSVIERDGIYLEMSSPLLNVLAKEFDGFLIGSEYSIGALGVFDATKLRLQGKPMPVDSWLKIFDTGAEFYEPRLDLERLKEIVSKSEEYRSREENYLLAALGVNK